MHEQIIPKPFLPINIEVIDNRIYLHASNGQNLDDCGLKLYWHYTGDQQWRVSVSNEFENLACSSERVSFTCRFSDQIAHVCINKLGTDNVWQFSGKLENTGDRPIELARFCYLTGNLPSDLRFLELQGPREKPVMRSTGDSLLPSRQDVEGFWGSMNVRWPRMPDTIHDTPDWSISRDVGLFLHDWQSSGWGFAFTGPRTAFGEIGFNTGSNPSEFYAGVLLDNILLDPGETRMLENAIVWNGDWQEGLKYWARACAEDAGVLLVKPAPVGYCSWYQTYDKVTPQEILTAANEFEIWPTPPGGKTIQIDDGFQEKPGCWGPNEKFKDAWQSLPGKIAATGAIPGIWVGPTTVHHSHSIVTQHPEWLQRIDGVPAISFGNWDGDTYYLEIDNPDAREFMFDIIRLLVDQGWRYFKLDFTYPITAARQAFDRKKTMLESLRSLYQLLRDACGPDVLMSACIGTPGRYALGSANYARLGGDIGSSWDAVQQTVRGWLTWSCTQGVWWQGDPDVFMMRTENSTLTFEESYLLTGTIGLFGGLFLTSDIPSQWSPEAVAATKEFWDDRGPRTPYDHRVYWGSDGNIKAYRVTVIENGRMLHKIGLYNWTENEQDTKVALDDIGLRSDLLWYLSTTPINDNMTLENGVLSAPTQPAHSIRICTLES